MLSAPEGSGVQFRGHRLPLLQDTEFGREYAGQHKAAASPMPLTDADGGAFPVTDILPQFFFLFRSLFVCFYSECLICIRGNSSLNYNFKTIF